VNVRVDETGQDGALAEVDHSRADGEIGDVADRADHACRAVLQQNRRAANTLRSYDPVGLKRVCHTGYYPLSKTQV
jgi:hypothetical protein